MTIQDAIQKLQNSSIEDRIQIIELLLKSLKEDIVTERKEERIVEPFKVRTFNLGGDIKFDRGEMYLERGL